MKAIIIDDEKGGRDYLADLIRQNCPGMKLIGEADSLESGVELLKKQDPDILFLDIELPGGSGFRLLDRLPSIPFQVIFTTAYSQYAYQAFRYSAIDYILKPVESTILTKAVNKAKQQKGNEYFQEKLKILMANMEPSTQKKVLLPRNKGYEVVKLNDIVYCKAEGNYTMVHFLKAKKILISKNLKELEKTLDPKGFFRSHQSYLVNLKYISRFCTGEIGEIELNKQFNIPIARSKKQEFLRLIKLWT